MITNPWILGLYPLAGTIFVAGTRMAGWYAPAADTARQPVITRRVS